MNLWQPFLKENIIDPYAMYKEIREKQPIYKTATGEVIFTKYNHVKSLLQSVELRSGIRHDWLKHHNDEFKKSGIDLSSTLKSLRCFMLFSNGNHHQILRKLVSSSLKAKKLSISIEQRALELMQKIELGSDIIESYCQVLPYEAALHLLGIDEKEARDLRSSVLDFSRILELYISMNDLEKVEKSASTLLHFFSIKIAELRRNPDQTFLSNIIKECDDKNILNDDDMSSLFLSILMAATETTTNFLGSTILTLLKYRTEFDQLLKNPDNIGLAVEELLRFEPPAQLTVRKAMTDFAMEGHSIKKGQTLVLCIGAANRDPKYFKNPEKLDLKRSPNLHLSFSSGLHRCLGDWLGRLETSSTIKAFFTVFGKRELSYHPDWNTLNTVRSLKSLVID
ncbi:MAG: cytochrome P450 [Bacteroidota bacterium]